MKTPKTNTPAQKPLVEIDTGFWVRPETVTSIEALTGLTPFPPRIVLWHGEKQTKIIPCASFEAAQVLTAVLAAKINS